MRTYFRETIAAILASTFFTTASFADDLKDMPQIMQLMRQGDWQGAGLLAKAANDPIVVDIYDWHRLRAGQGRIPEYVSFFRENSDWPGLPWMQDAAERNLPKDERPEEIIAFFTEFGPPRTSAGVERLVTAHMQNGDNEAAKSTLLFAIDKVKLTPETVTVIREILPELQALLPRHIDYLIFEGDYEDARALLEFIDDEEKRALLDVRIRLSKDEAVGDEELQRYIDAETIDGGINWALFGAKRRADDYQNALVILEDASQSAETLGRPEYWEDIRGRYARQVLRDGEPERAYKLAANHHIEDMSTAAELEWLAGFIALEFLDDPDLARAHFQTFKMNVNTPISNGRAGYWLGRAGDPEGYDYGAQYLTSFYGQLSAEMVGEFDEALTKNPDNDLWRTPEFLSRESIHAGLIFKATGEYLLARRFFAHDAETMPEELLDAAGIMAQNLGMPDAAVNIGKNAANRNIILYNSYYPIVDLQKYELSAPFALALAVSRQESEFYTPAQSHAGAKGLMQLMPFTAEAMATKLDVPYDEPALLSDPAYNVQLGTAYLEELMEHFDNSLPLVAGGYNAGPSRSEDWVSRFGDPRNASIEDAVFYVEMIPFNETRNYVQRIIEGVFVYDAKLRGEFAYMPSDLLTKPYDDTFFYSEQ